MEKKLVLKKKLIVELSDMQANQIKGGGTVSLMPILCGPGDKTTIYGDVCIQTNTCYYCPTTNAYDTDCCSADLEICNTNSDPYCGAC